MHGKKDLLIHLAALVSFALSVSLWFLGYRDEGLFVGIWVPSIFGYGTYTQVTRMRS